MKKRNFWFIRIPALWLLCAAVLSGIAFVQKDVTAKIKTKTVRKTFVVMAGATREIADISVPKTKASVMNKKIAGVSLNEETSYAAVSYRAGAGFSYGILVRGKKAGRTKLTVQTPKTKTIYTVKVLSKAAVKKSAVKALKKYAAKLKKIKQCAYEDFNGDGIKELYCDGKFIYYNYATQKVVTKKSPLAKLGKLYVSTKSALMFAMPEKETPIGTANDDGTYESYLYGKFFLMNRAKVFDFLDHDVDFARYGNPKEYVGEKYEPETDYYMIGDHGYDQDDYWYEPYTRQEMDDKLQELMPEMKEIKMAKKVVIK